MEEFKTLDPDTDAATILDIYIYHLMANTTVYFHVKTGSDNCWFQVLPQ
jgi:hypothetical protein